MQNLTLGLIIGATVSGTFQIAFGQADRALSTLGKQTEKLTAKQQRLGGIMSRSLARPQANLSKLHSQYQKLGKIIDDTRRSQERLSRAMSINNKVTGLQNSTKTGAMNEAAKLAMIGGGVGYAVKQSAIFEDQIIDIGITAELSKSEQKVLAQNVRANALKYNQTTDAINEGIGVLVSNNIQDLKELNEYTAVLGEFATAERVTMPDAGNLVSTLNTQWGVSAKDSKEHLNMLTYAGKAGSFEIDAMAKRLPEFAQYYKGIDSRIATAELGANFQIARMGAGSSDEAATNMRSFYSKLFAPDTIRDFSKAGIDLQTSMKNLISEGLTPTAAMMQITGDYIGTKSPQAAAEFSKAMKIKDEEERAQALSRVEEQYKLGELFQDMQAMSFIRSYQNNQQKHQEIFQGSLALAGNGKDIIGADNTERMGSSLEQYKSLKIFVDDLAITLGDIFKPALLDVANAIKPMIAGFAQWAKENPKIVSGMVGLVAGLIAAKLAFFAIGFVVLSIISPFTKLFVVFRQVRAALVFIRGLNALGRFAPMAMRFGRALGFVGRAIRILRIAGMALMTNPLFLAIGLLAGAAFLVYKNWDKIGPYFSKLWNKLKSFAKSGVSNILLTIASFSPIGLFIRAWSAVFSYFSGLTAKFRQYGSNIIQGLIGGITAKFGALKAKASEMASSIAGVFSGKLEINSPSKLFTRIAHSIPEGIALGVTNKAGIALGAISNLSKRIGTSKIENPQTTDMANRLAQTEYSNKVLGTQSLNNNGTGSGQIHFSPTINISVGADNGDIAGQVQQGLATSYAEFERMLAQVEANRQRRAFV